MFPQAESAVHAHKFSHEILSSKFNNNVKTEILYSQIFIGPRDMNNINFSLINYMNVILIAVVGKVSMIECSDKRHIVVYHDSRDTLEYLIVHQVSKKYPLARMSSGIHNYGTALFTF
jgi:hypothetical protein